MEIFLHIIYMIAGVAALYYGADFLVRGGVDIAQRFGISSLVIGLTLVAFATSAPELAVSLSAAFSGNPDISVGNVVGSNIANIGLILGICACILPLNVNNQLLKVDTPFMVAAGGAITVPLLLFGGMNRIVGAVLFSLLLIYVIWSVYDSRKHSEEEEKITSKYPLYLAVIIVIASLAVLVVGAEIFLKSAVFFAKMFKISDAVIGLTVVAVGTSLPELATSIVAACKGEKDIAIGNVVGSNIFNSLCILGLTSVVKPIHNITLNIVDFGFMIFLSVLLLAMMFTSRKVNRVEGAILFVCYVGYTVYLCINA